MQIKRGTTEERDERRAAKDAERAAKDAQRQADRQAKARNQIYTAFLASPAGKAREAYEAGDQVYQYALDVLSTQTMHVAMVGVYSRPKSNNDPSAILNSVCHEGWELVNGSFVFLETGSESRDKFGASGQHVAVSGTIMGYYLFKRCEANRRETPINPWDDPARIAEVAGTVTA